MIGTLVWGAPHWAWWLAVLAAAALVLVLHAYRSAPASRTVRWTAGLVKAVALAALLIVLAEPLWYGVRARPGANIFLVVADNSRSMLVADEPGGKPRSEKLADATRDDAPWLTRLGQDFELRRYLFADQLRYVDTFAELDFSGIGSPIGTTIRELARRYAGRPVAGILLLTDGISTDTIELSDSLPPVYPVLVGNPRPACDVRVEEVSGAESYFQSAPLSVTVTVGAERVAGQKIVVQVINEHDRIEQTDWWQPSSGGRRQWVFRFRPQDESEFYRVRAYLADELPDLHGSQPPEKSREVTLLNNERWFRPLVMRGPYRVLYVGGRPNWDFKFLRRAIERDDEVRLTALVRIAHRQPKFIFREQFQDTNPLFRGFDPPDKEQLERYDQPVLLRLSVESPEELRQGFPVRMEDLYRYDAVILDDIEATFFNADQLSLLHQYVSQRGGGLLLIGGAESFVEGRYGRTVLEDLAPVYIPTSLAEEAYSASDAGYRLEMTRDGQLQPWLRLRTTWQDEQKRLEQLPAFQVRNAVGQPKPGAAVLLALRDAEGRLHPALVTQRFGRGRTAALLIGDLWRWYLKQPDSRAADDFQYHWVQLVRWLVTGGLRRAELSLSKLPAQRLVELSVKVRDVRFEPLDNAQLQFTITDPTGKEWALVAEADEVQPGGYRADFVCRQEGNYRATLHITGPDGETFDTLKTGWVHQPMADELKQLEPDRRALEQLAKATGGELISLEQLERLVQSLPTRKVPVTDPWVYPLWHRWPVLLLVFAALLLEWGLRRIRGLP
ncbi:MAG: membrane protein [Pirellulaceae bacterium]|nr:MAG: membrane protein [Pirellulaceae bacterium]